MIFYHVVLTGTSRCLIRWLNSGKGKPLTRISTWKPPNNMIVYFLKKIRKIRELD